MKKLKEKLKKLNQNKEFVSFLSREKDIEFQMNTERSEGKIESKIEIAKNMLFAEEPIEKIMTFTGLTLNEIESLK